MFLNNVLEFFGLITMKRAMYIHRKIHSAYAKSIGDMAHEQFGAKKKPNVVEDAEAWADYAWNEAMKARSKEVDIQIGDLE